MELVSLRLCIQFFDQLITQDIAIDCSVSRKSTKLCRKHQKLTQNGFPSGFSSLSWHRSHSIGQVPWFVKPSNKWHIENGEKQMIGLGLHQFFLVHFESRWILKAGWKSSSSDQLPKHSWFFRNGFLAPVYLFQTLITSEIRSKWTQSQPKWSFWEIGNNLFSNYGNFHRFNVCWTNMRWCCLKSIWF